ncbi:MAG: ABC transporter substrate-binding protein [Gammaproteobacteria bacterium]|nr:ABC transporter substrate-binding protein [Gammaproteobacteria bacterium]
MKLLSILPKTSASLRITLLVLGLIVAGCAPAPIEQVPELPPPPEDQTSETTEQPAQEDAQLEEPVATVPEPQPEERQVTTFGLQNEEQVIPLDDPWKLVEQAISLPAERALGLQIRAVEEFLNQNRVEAAVATLEALSMIPVSPDDRVQVEILRGRILLAQGDAESALRQLKRIYLGSVLSQPIRLGYLETLVKAYEANGQGLDATAVIIELHDLSEGEARPIWQKQVIEKIRTLNPLDRSFLAEQSTHDNTPGWISLAETLDFGKPEFLYTDFMDWRKFYPDHPANLDVLTLVQEPYDQTEYGQIALLLPLTSDVGSAAQAFHDGFMDATTRYQSDSQPDIVLYDIGNSASLSRIYYRAAIDDGANLIIGPLGREATNALLNGFTGEIDTLMITDIPDETRLPRLFAFSLSPEEEAKLVAEKAWDDGHRQATVFKAASQWGDRVASAFIKHWESIGGVSVKSEPFQTGQVDYSTTIQNFLGIDRSIQRRKNLEAYLDRRLKFTPRRNEDMDFIFLASNFAQARIVVPQLRFFQAHNLPVYATSYVYSGIPSPELDGDLNEVIFPDMRWMLQGIEVYRRMKAEQELAEISINEELPTDPSNGESGQSELDQQPETETVDQEVADTETDTADEPADPDSTVLAAAENEDTGRSDSLAGNLAPYRNTGLDRIYALGLQSYLLAPRLNALRNDPTIEYSGPAMTVSLSENGEVIRQPVWLVFREGLPELKKSLSGK